MGNAVAVEVGGVHPGGETGDAGQRVDNAAPIAGQLVQFGQYQGVGVHGHRGLARADGGEELAGAAGAQRHVGCVPHIGDVGELGFRQQHNVARPVDVVRQHLQAVVGLGTQQACSVEIRTGDAEVGGGAAAQVQLLNGAEAAGEAAEVADAQGVGLHAVKAAAAIHQDKVVVARG